jgi:exodeoxyribonuclease-3
MLKLISWNIDSLNAALTSDSARALMSRDVLSGIQKEAPDILAIQETKLPYKGPSKKHMEILAEKFPAYDYVFTCSREPARKSYAGTMTFYKKGLAPVITYPEIGAPRNYGIWKGRIITLEFKDFFFTHVYTPNSGNTLGRLGDRQVWDRRYGSYLASLDKSKPLIAAGDFNVAHTEIDLANPDSNHMSAGFTDEEREGLFQLTFHGIYRYIQTYPR